MTEQNKGYSIFTKKVHENEKNILEINNFIENISDHAT